MKTLFLSLSCWVAAACAITSVPPAPINTAEVVVADDRAADSLLVELSALDTTIVIDMRYATKPLRFDRVVR